MLSVFDACGSGGRLCEAINENTDHTAQLFQWKTGPFNHPHGHMVRDLKAVQGAVDEADVIHVKGDRPWKRFFPEIKHLKSVRIDHKPVVLTLSGTLTREIRFGGYGQRPQYPAKLITAHEPDLKHDWVDVLTHYPIRRAEATWHRSDPPYLLHIPSNRITKGTDFVESIIKNMKQRFSFQVLGNMPYHESVETKKKATLYFDQFIIGWYGNAGVEAMNYGVPVVSWISDFSRKQVCSPVITSEGGAKQWASMLDWVLEKDMTELSKMTKEYCDRTHSYEAVATQWNDIYESL